MKTKTKVEKVVKPKVIKPKTEKVTKPKVTSSYTATIKIMGRTYEFKAETISEAIKGLKPANCKGKAILTITRGDASKERILMPAITFRMFNASGFSKEVAIKNISSLFQGI